MSATVAVLRRDTNFGHGKAISAEMLILNCRQSHTEEDLQASTVYTARKCLLRQRRLTRIYPDRSNRPVLTEIQSQGGDAIEVLE